MSLQILTILLVSFISSSSEISTLTHGGSLSAPYDFLTSSPAGNFTAGFLPVGDNAYCFAIWFTDILVNGGRTVVWMANRDRPVNGEKSTLSVKKSGEVVLNDAGQTDIWSTRPGSGSGSPVELTLNDNGNLVLQEQSTNRVLWQSFDFPTDTLLPQQPLTGNSKLVSARSLTNYSSGFYRLFFDADNVLKLLYDGFGITSFYWPSPWLNSWLAGRSSYSTNKIAVLDSFGCFNSSDDFKFKTSDSGVVIPRIMRLDIDGGLRVYSLDRTRKKWKVTWQANSKPCTIHGICGPNSLCNYIGHTGNRECSCLPGHRMKNRTDWAYGCEPEFDITCKDSGLKFEFIRLNHVQFYGFDFHFRSNTSLQDCRKTCLRDCRCRGFQYNFDETSCYPKTFLFNGFRSSGFRNPTYVKIPRGSSHITISSEHLKCQRKEAVVLYTDYKTKNQSGWVKSFFWCTCVIGIFEILCLLMYWIKTSTRSEETMRGYQKIAVRFQNFSYAELKKATRNFSEEIGRGGSGVVYKGKLPDDRIAAIKRLNEASQGEEEFLAEVSTMGKLNHMNLIEIWGYCAERKHRLLVYEYMEHGSLAKNLYSNKLDWEKRFEIALGTARGLAYLHEECLEWVLHFDVKPENILLDSEFKPKVIDFGLSKLLKRGATTSRVSRIRGTRGYMAPEWVYNLPITCKVDVYSYGIVLLEMITGKSPLGFQAEEADNSMEQRMLVTWVREKTMNRGLENTMWIEDIVDPALEGKYDLKQLEVLVNVALKCSEEDRHARPTMSQVVHMLLSVTEE